MTSYSEDSKGAVLSPRTSMSGGLLLGRRARRDYPQRLVTTRVRQMGRCPTGSAPSTRKEESGGSTSPSPGLAMKYTWFRRFPHYDMDPGRSTARGVELLRQYLEFAASGGSELGATTSGVPLNAFELDVMNRLTEKGIPVTPQYGVAGYWLDFACGHPDPAGGMVLAIEADGASYHSAYTARERDRLRQELLEIKGWRFHRIWSTAWFRTSG